MRMAYAARKQGADLQEGFEVTGADFDKQQGLWTVSSSDVSLACLPAAVPITCSQRPRVMGVPEHSFNSDIVSAQQGKKVKARLLVIADGATSRLATKLGYCTEAPRGVCSRAFVEGGTHNTDFDGALADFLGCCVAIFSIAFSAQKMHS